MKYILLIFMTISLNGQTNVYNSEITTQKTSLGLTNVLTKTKMVVLPRAIVERIHWEVMLNYRREIIFQSYLNGSVNRFK